MAINRKELIKLLNEDLSREYQAIIAYVNYSQVLKGAAYMQIAKELETHAAEELAHRGVEHERREGDAHQRPRKSWGEGRDSPRTSRARPRILEIAT